ncbi:hypothetical protein GCM10022252_66310 [Streptosporangium oxazolinicum]|uniref:Uncharacterized protein n=1 Tax=Streptosporangium oxazolinicum TaxID=909287 RepID=A0ABP8BFD8_9ACTN
MSRQRRERPPTSAWRESTSPGEPPANDPGREEVAHTYGFLGGRPLYVDRPRPDDVEWRNASFPYLEKGPFDGIGIQRGTVPKAPRSRPGPARGAAVDRGRTGPAGDLTSPAGAGTSKDVRKRGPRTSRARP